jgi:hypothetical protein
MRNLDLSNLGRVLARSVHPSAADIRRLHRHVRFVPIVLQKSKVAAALILAENLKREDIGDSYSLSRATEVAYEFSVWR